MTLRWTAGVRREVLPNGLTLLVQRDDSAPVASVVTHVKAGFFDEPDHWVGISHVLEHMYFKGTATRPAGAIARETKAAGGYLNASTTYDHTSYFAVLPAANLAQAIAIQADALLHAAIDEGELARELQVIIQEAKRKLDNPSAVTHETLHEVMFDRHRIRRWRIGYEAELAGFTRDDVWDYYRSRYVPSRTIVAIVGAMDPETALELARAAYGEWPERAGAHDPSPQEPPRSTVRARTLRGDVTQAEVALGWRTVEPLHPDSPALDLAAGVLSTGRGSWLYRALREPGLVTSVSAHNYGPTEIGIFTASAELAPERVPEAVGRIAEAVARLSMLGPAEADLERARTLLLTRWARRMESMDGRAASLAAAEALQGYELLDREYDQLATTSAEQIREAAARHLRPDSVSGVVYLPKARGQDLTPVTLERTFELSELKRLDTPAPFAPRPRAAATAVAAERAGVLHTALAGVDLLVRRKPGVPTVTLGLYVPRADPEPAGRAGLGALTVRSSIRGAGGMDAGQLAFAFERLGGTLGGSVSLDWLGFSATVMAERLAEAAALLDRVFTSPDLEAEEILAERSLLIEETAQVADDMFRYPFQLAFAAAFGDRGYGLPALGLPDTLGGIGVEEVRNWHPLALASQRAVVVAVGDVDPERASNDLAGIFGGYPRRATGGAFSPVEWLVDGESRCRVVTRDKAQAALAMAFPGPSRRDAGRYAAEVWAAVASGLGGRLFEALRDRRSLAYTVMASSWQKARGGALLTYIATSPERETEARETMLEELDRFARETVADHELRQAANYLAGQAEVNRQSGTALASEIVEAWLLGAGLEDLADPAAQYRAVTAEQIREVAQAGLRRERRAEGVVRGSGGGK